MTIRLSKKFSVALTLTLAACASESQSHRPSEVKNQTTGGGQLSLVNVVATSPGYTLPTSGDALSALQPWLGTSAVGFNEGFIGGLLLAAGASCNGCAPPTNTIPMSQNFMTSLLQELATAEHVGSYREIVPTAYLEPSQGDQENYGTVLSALETYAGFNLYLTMSFGSPIPNWMTSNGWAFLPPNGGDFTPLKNNLSGTIGNFLVYASQHGSSTLKAWMPTHLFVEPFNEFDAVADTNGNTVPAPGTPQDAAALQGGINFVVNAAGLHVQFLAPSITGRVYVGYSGPMTSFVNVLSQYFTDYYAAGGGGVPNIHMYPPTASEAPGQAVADIISDVQAINKALPAPYVDKMVLGEAGIPSGGCAGAVDPGMRGSLYASMAQSLLGTVTAIHFWRLLELPASNGLPASSCENFYGVLPPPTMGPLAAPPAPAPPVAPPVAAAAPPAAPAPAAAPAAPAPAAAPAAPAAPAAAPPAALAQLPEPPKDPTTTVLPEAAASSSVLPLLYPEALLDCQELGKIYDRMTGNCTAQTLTKPCDYPTILAQYGAANASAIQRLQTAGYLPDQCGSDPTNGFVAYFVCIQDKGNPQCVQPSAAGGAQLTIDVKCINTECE